MRYVHVKAGLSLSTIDEVLISVREVAEKAGCSAQTIKRWAKQSKVPRPKKLKSSGRLVFTEPQVREILKYARETN